MTEYGGAVCNTSTADAQRGVLNAVAPVRSTALLRRVLLGFLCALVMPVATFETLAGETRPSVTTVVRTPTVDADVEACRQLLWRQGVTPVEHLNGVHAQHSDVWRTASAAGSAGAKWLRALCWLYGVGGDRQPQRGVAMLTQAAEAGFPDAMTALGRVYAEGKVLHETKRDSAIDWYRRAADAGDPEGMNRLALALMNTSGKEVELAKALLLYTQAASLGHSAASVNLGLCLSALEQFEPDMDAVALFRTAAEAGFSRGMYYLGWAYENGRGVFQNADTAREWYSRAARAGDARGKAVLAGMGPSSARDADESDAGRVPAGFRNAVWLQDDQCGVQSYVPRTVFPNPLYLLTCVNCGELGLVRTHAAATSLGNEHRSSVRLTDSVVFGTTARSHEFEILGPRPRPLPSSAGEPKIEAGGSLAGWEEVVRKDLDECRRALWQRGSQPVEYLQKVHDGSLPAWQAGSAAGSRDAQWLLSVCWFNGVGGDPRPAQALEILMKAAEAGSLDAITDLGLLYGRGSSSLGLELVKCASYLRLAADAGNPEAMNWLGLVHMSGKGTNVSAPEAFIWFRRAALHGHSAAMVNLALAYTAFEEVGVRGYAAPYLRKAAENGYGRAMYCMGKATEQGRWAGSNAETALEWYTKAAAAGEERASRAIARLKAIEASRWSAIRKFVVSDSPAHDHDLDDDLDDDLVGTDFSSRVSIPSRMYHLRCVDCGALGSYGSYAQARAVGNAHSASSAQADAENYGAGGASHVTIVGE